MVEIRAVDAGCRDALAELFTANGTVAGCGCMFFVADAAEFKAGWHSRANRDRDCSRSNLASAWSSRRPAISRGTTRCTRRAEASGAV